MSILTGIAFGTRVVIVAGKVVLLRRIRAFPRRVVAGPDVMALVTCGAPYGTEPLALAGNAIVGLRARIAVVAGRLLGFGRVGA